MNDTNINLLGILDNAPMCIKLFDKEGKILFMNKFGREEHFLTENEDVSNWDWRKTIKAEYLPEVNDSVSRVFNGNSPVEYVEFEHTKEGSSHPWCSGALSSVIDKDGNVEGVLFYSQDVTEKKKSEEAIRNKIEELEKLNKLMINREIKMIELKSEIAQLKGGK